MRTPLLATISLFVFFQAYSQKQSAVKQFPVKIEGTISNFNGKKIYLHHKWDEKDYTDSAVVKQGKFFFNLKSPEPNMYWFTLSRDISEQPNFIFWADQAPIKASLKGDSIIYSSVEAGQTHKDYIDYRMFINSMVMAQTKMQEDFNTAVQNQDMNMQNAIRAEYQNLNNQYLAGLKNFIKTHPTSPVSGYVLYSDLNNPNIPISEVLEAASYIDKSIENTKYVQLANKRLDDVKGTMVGYTAKNFSQTTPDGKKVSLTDFRGKYVLIDFWASWCRPCRMENPNVVSAYNKYKDKGFTVLGVSMDTNKDLWVAAIQQDNLTWTHVSDLKGWANEVGKLYNVTGIPQNYLIDKEGKIVAKDLRGAALDEKLAETIK